MVDQKLVRFAYLNKALGVCDSRAQLANLIRDQNFPPGRLLGEKSPVWWNIEIEDWLDARPVPTERTADTRGARSRCGAYRSRPRGVARESNRSRKDHTRTVPTCFQTRSPQTLRVAEIAIGKSRRPLSPKRSPLCCDQRSFRKNVSIIPLPLISMVPRRSKSNRSPSASRVAADT